MDFSDEYKLRYIGHIVLWDTWCIDYRKKVKKNVLILLVEK
jgi:hypothetical protein